MADPAAGTPSSDNGAAIVSERLTALLLKEDDIRGASTAVRERSDSLSSFNIPPTPPPSLETPSHLRRNGGNVSSLSRRPLFSSVREALESSGQLKEEPGGYVIKRHSGRQQQQQQQPRSTEKAGRSKYRQAKSSSSGDTTAANSVEDEADAAGYTVIRRRSSCDESSFSASATTSHSQPTARRNPRPSTQARANRKPQSQRPRRGSMSALPQTSSLLASISPASSSSVPPGFQPCPAASRVAMRPPPGLTPAASGWVVKAAAPAEHANKIEEPPVEALWPEVTTQNASSGGWAVATTAVSTSEGSLQAQAWPAAASGDASRSASAMQADDHKDGVDYDDDDDLLARLGVTL